MANKKTVGELKRLNKELEAGGLSRARAHAETLKLLALSDALDALGKIASSLDAIDARLSTVGSSVAMIETRLLSLPWPATATSTAPPSKQ